MKTLIATMLLLACRGPAGAPGVDGEDGQPGAQGPMGPTAGFSTAIRTRCASTSTGVGPFEHESYLFQDGSKFVTCSAYGDAYATVIYPKADWIGAATSACQIRVPYEYVITMEISGTTSTVTRAGASTTTTPIPCNTTP
jgi:hypothetical protein